MKNFLALLHRRLVKACGYSLQGLAAGLRHEEAFRVEVVLSLVLIPLGLWLGDSQAEKAILMMTVILVLIVELLNSGVEAAIDRISLDRDELAGRAKDMGSAAVFLSMLLMVAVWSLILLNG